MSIINPDDFLFWDTLHPTTLAYSFIAEDFEIALANELDLSSFNELVVFGDSLSDTGNLLPPTGGLFPPSELYFEGRFSNGPIWVDFFTESLGYEVSNFAIAGATSSSENIIRDFSGLDNLPDSLDFLGLTTQLENFQTEITTASADQLYFLFIGNNDFFELLGGDVTTDPTTVITNSITNISNAVIGLANSGVETIAISNLPDLGLTPLAIEAGASSDATLATLAFNTALSEALETLEPALGIDIVELDTFSIANDLATSGEFTVIDQPLLPFETPLESNPIPEPSNVIALFFVLLLGLIFKRKFVAN